MAEKTDLLGSEGKPDDEVDGLGKDLSSVDGESNFAVAARAIGH